MAQTIMSLIKWWRGRSSDNRNDKTGEHSGRKTKPVKLPKTPWVTVSRSSTKLPTRWPCVMILNIAKIRVKNDTTVMVSNLSSRHKLHGQIENKRNIRDIKRVRTKRALSSSRKRGTIGSMNSAITIRRTQNRKMSKVMSHMKVSARI
jgi:hypothetical protein